MNHHGSHDLLVGYSTHSFGSLLHGPVSEGRFTSMCVLVTSYRLNKERKLLEVGYFDHHKFCIFCNQKLINKLLVKG